MGEFRNPAILGSAPADGQLAQYSAATDTWTPVSAASVGVLVVPQAHEGAVTPTSSQNATTNASAPSAGYVQAEAATAATLANALKVSYNAAQVDIAAIATRLNSLLTELQTAGILS